MNGLGNEKKLKGKRKKSRVVCKRRSKQIIIIIIRCCFFLFVERQKSLPIQRQKKKKIVCIRIYNPCGRCGDRRCFERRELHEQEGKRNEKRNVYHSRYLNYMFVPAVILNIIIKELKKKKKRY